MPDNVDRMTGGFYIWCILYSDEREITLNPEYWVCGWGRAWWLVVVVMVVVVDISRYFPIETEWCPSQHFHHQTSPTHQTPPAHSLCWTVTQHTSQAPCLLSRAPSSLLLLQVATSSLLSSVQHYERYCAGWQGGARQIFYHNYLLNQAVSPLPLTPNWWSNCSAEEKIFSVNITADRPTTTQLSMPLISSIN